MLEFIFYMGWLQTAHEHLNPMGSDADDFEVNYMLDRNIKVSIRLMSGILQCIFQVGFMIVDEARTHYCSLVRDAYWDKSDIEVPHTVASAEVGNRPYEHSTHGIQ